MKKKFLVIILGPTAAGKTALSVQVAKHFRTEIISADSRQFYRELEIGTAKPSATDLKSVRHHFINSLSIHQEYNAGMFEEDALKILNRIFQKNNIAVLTGGSGLYIDAVCRGFDKLPPADKTIRRKLENAGIETLRAMLKKLDEAHYKNADLLNPHRLIRAIEVCLLTGKKYSGLRKKKEKHERNFSVIKTGLFIEREKLYQRINARVDEMMRNGLLEEARALLPYKDNNSLNTHGYKELFPYLEGKTNLETAVEKIKQDTRHYAKRQMTWFKRDKEIKWFEASALTQVIPYLESVIGKQ